MKLCPSCGGEMYHTSKLCGKCYIKKIKKEAKPKEYWRKYHAEYKRNLRANNPEKNREYITNTCECGGLKLKGSKRCLGCYKKDRAGNKRTKGDISKYAKKYSKNYRKKNKEKLRIEGKKFDTLYRERLSDRYIKKVINQQTGLPRKEIPEGLIDFKRAQIELIRSLKEREPQWNL